MPISFTCPHCGKQTNVDDRFAGQTGPCANCGQAVTIPGGSPFTGAPVAPAVAKKSTSGATIVLVVVVCLVGLCLCGGILPALLLPAIQAAREAARRAQCSNNMKQISLALMNYHDTYKTFPPAYIPDETGKPMHSWRVLILPFLEQQALYNQYNFNEPWDSSANQLITSTSLSVFQCPSATTGSTETNYMVVTGPGTVFDGAKATSMAEITDGTSNTLLAVEVVGTGVKWAQPVDLDASQLSPPWSLTGGPGQAGSHHPGGINAAMCDGSVQFLSNAISPATVQGMATKSGGEMNPGNY
jgi:prepilin-type processing-associated H-X9-DG protein